MSWLLYTFQGSPEKIGPMGSVHVERKWCYRELPHVTMSMTRAQICRVSSKLKTQYSWRCSSAQSPKAPKIQENWKHSFSPTAVGSWPRRSQYFSSTSKARKSCVSIWRKKERQEKGCLLLKWMSAVLFYSDLQLIGWDQPTFRRAICFTQTQQFKSHLKISSQKKPMSIMFDQISGHLCLSLFYK